VESVRLKEEDRERKKRGGWEEEGGGHVEKIAQSQGRPSSPITPNLTAVCFFVLCNRHWFNRVPGPVT
jgi:hypothetical protein